MDRARSTESISNILRNSALRSVPIHKNVIVTTRKKSSSIKPNYNNLHPLKASRVLIMDIGFDLGTKNIVLSYKDKEGKVQYINEVNGYWRIPRMTPFMKNTLDNATITRSDGTKRPVRWIELGNEAFILGRDAEEFAYSNNDTLCRPMAEGGVSFDEQAMSILSILVHGLLDVAATEVGQFGDKLNICYCTTAKAINGTLNIDFHSKVVNHIITTYETKSSISSTTIKESHAIILDASPNATGIGISWGAGTVTVSYVKYGVEIFSFCWIGAGDWIDKEVAIRHGYSPELRNKSKETPTTISKRKMSVDLSEGVVLDRIGMDISFMYQCLIENVVGGIIDGFNIHANEARIEDGINIYMAGGTSSPKGFIEFVKKVIDSRSMPFQINDIIRVDDPLFSVSRGCLIAAEMSNA